MKNTKAVSVLLGAIALTSALLLVLMVTVLCTGQAALAQSAPNPAPNPATQSQPTMPPDQNAPGTAPTPEEKTFTGKIGKIGDKLVLIDGESTYQLVDQEKIQAFENKTVKVTGVLDTATGTIRVSSIRPT